MAKTRFEQISTLLCDYGLSKIDRAQFNGQMAKLGISQEEIDRWCEEYHRLVESVEQRREQETWRRPE